MTIPVYHADIERVFAELDARYDMLDVQVEGYCLWPTLKVVLWRYMMSTFVADRNDSPQGMVQTSRIRRLKKYAEVIPASLMFLVRGWFYQLRYNPALPKNGVVLVYAGRLSRDPQGHTLPTYFGDIVADTGRGPAIAVNDSGVFTPPPAPVIASQYFRAKTFLRMAVKLALRLYPTEFYSGVRELLNRLEEFGKGCEQCPRSALWLAAAHFVESKAVYTSFFKKIVPRKVMVTDFDAHFGVVAAARNCGIPVYDMQHGTFWSHDLDHSWRGVQCDKHRAALPFPDKLLVFGKFWQDIAAEQGLWANDNVDVVGAPVMEKYLPLRKNPDKFALSARPALLYLSGDIKPQSVADWMDRFLATDVDVHLRIRLHPREIGYKNPYQFLADKYPAYVTFSHMDNTTLNDILNTDIVIGTSTTAMIEALILGIPVISMGAGATPEGIAAIHKNTLLSELIAHAGSPSDLIVYLTDMQNNPAAWRARLKRTEELQNHFYADNYNTHMKAIIRA